MEKHKKVSGLVAWSKAKCSVIVFVAAVCIYTPLIWTLWHDEKPSCETQTTPVWRCSTCSDGIHH